MPFDGTDLRNLQIARLQIFCEIARTHPYKSQKTFETCLAGEMWADPRLIELGINYARWNGVDRLPTFFGVTVVVLHICSAIVRKSGSLGCLSRPLPS
jgi:hypothetical protein